LGGVQAWLGSGARKQGLKLVYGEKYKSNSHAPKPISYYIDVDIHLPGCPVNQNELADVLGALLAGRTPTEARYPVCLECKARENDCLLLAGEACLGPVTKGGCEAACPSRGLRCWGCFGALRGGNTKAMKKKLEVMFGPERTQQLLAMFYSEQDEYKALYASSPVIPGRKPGNQLQPAIDSRLRENDERGSGQATNTTKKEKE
jgi:hypothetical protein